MSLVFVFIHVSVREPLGLLLVISSQYGFLHVIPRFLIKRMSYVPKDAVFTTPAGHGNKTAIVTFDNFEILDDEGVV